MQKKLVIFGASNIVSDLFECALASQIKIKKVVLHESETLGERDRSIYDRVEDLRAFGMEIAVLEFSEFSPELDEIYILGPTTPSRAEIVKDLKAKFSELRFTNLIHPTAYVSPLATMGHGVFVGANSVVGPGAKLADHVFVNRGVTIGHDTRIGAFSRIQPGSNVGGLTTIGRGVTVGIGATIIERLVIGDDAFVGAGAVVTTDVSPSVLVVGVPAKLKKVL